MSLAACGGGSSGASDWYYHWNCNGDATCLTTNSWGKPSGTANVGPVESDCRALMLFASKNWGAAFNSCDHSSSFPDLLLSIVVTPSNAAVPLGATQQFTATGRFADGTSRDVTAQAAWSATNVSAGATVASVAAGGLATTLAQGQATIAAAVGAVSGSTTMRVGPVAVTSITLDPANPTIAKGQVQAFTAWGHYSDGSTANITASISMWTSGTPSVATIDVSGKATGVGAGTSLVTASTFGASGSTQLTVTGPALTGIAVQPASPTVAIGYPRALRAVGTYSDGTAADITGIATWSSASSTATVASGLVTGVAAGPVDVSAAVGALSGKTTVTVTSATLSSIAVSPATPSLPPGGAVALVATGHFSDGTAQRLVTGVAWSSLATGVATVDAGGLATAVALGSATLTATVGGTSGSAALVVTADPPGNTWTYHPSGAGGQLNGVAASPLAFVAGGTNDLRTSPDGLSWPSGLSSPSINVRGVAYAPELGRWVAVGGGTILYSADGSVWSTATGPFASAVLRAVAWSGTRFVALGDSSAFWSADGVSWTAAAQLPPTGFSFRGAVWNGVQFLAVGNGTAVSADGTAWTQTDSIGCCWNGVAWSGGRYVRVHFSGLVQSSADGAAWTDRISTSNLYGVIWADAQFVAVGGSGVSDGNVSTSPDGVSWTRRTLGTAGTPSGATVPLYGVAWNGARFVAVGYGGYTWTSP